MSILSLGYIGVRSAKLEDWSQFATSLLGMEKVDQSGKNAIFRMDDRKQRLIVSDEAGDTLAFLGWEVDSKESLDALASKLSDHDIKVTEADVSTCDRRCVRQMFCIDDPDGNRLEFFCNPMIADSPFVPGRPIDGFKTGPYGMGHAVLHVRDAPALLPFYRDLLGFKLSDFGQTPYPLYFFHVNGRHHSFAMVGSGKTGFHHFMVEFRNLDDVGQGYDLAQLQNDCVAYTLGRHTNDYMTSYYANTPSDFFVESGWGGRIIDPATWTAEETFDGPSFWGHERLYLDKKPREEMRELRLQAARHGHRTPPLIDCPWLYNQIEKQ